MRTKEHVVLINKQNEVLGTTPKSSVHHKNTPLHRAFSLFLFNSEKKLLLQQRAQHKKTWPLVWSNSCCGHPALKESTEEAIRRRLKQELEITKAKLKEVLPDFRYRAEQDGVVENEICPVWVGFSEEVPKPNPEEVENIAWVDWKNFCEMTEKNEGPFVPLSPWCIQETKLLQQNQKIQKLLKQWT